MRQAEPLHLGSLLSPHGAGAVCWYGKLYLRSTTQRAGGVHGSIVRPDCLPCDRQTQTCTTRFIGYVRLPDSLQIIGGDSLAVVGDRDADGIASTEFRQSRRHGDASVTARSIDCVEQHIAQSAGERAVVSVHTRQILVDLQIESNAGWHAAARRVAN